MDKTHQTKPVQQMLVQADQSSQINRNHAALKQSADTNHQALKNLVQSKTQREPVLSTLNQSRLSSALKQRKLEVKREKEKAEKSWRKKVDQAGFQNKTAGRANLNSPEALKATQFSSNLLQQNHSQEDFDPILVNRPAAQNKFASQSRLFLGQNHKSDKEKTARELSCRVSDPRQVLNLTQTTNHLNQNNAASVTNQVSKRNLAINRLNQARSKAEIRQQISSTAPAFKLKQDNFHTETKQETRLTKPNFKLNDPKSNAPYKYGTNYSQNSCSPANLQDRTRLNQNREKQLQQKRQNTKAKKEEDLLAQKKENHTPTKTSQNQILTKTENLQSKSRREKEEQREKQFQQARIQQTKTDLAASPLPQNKDPSLSNQKADKSRSITGIKKSSDTPVLSQNQKLQQLEPADSKKTGLIQKVSSHQLSQAGSTLPGQRSAASLFSRKNLSKQRQRHFQPESSLFSDLKAPSIHEAAKKEGKGSELKLSTKTRNSKLLAVLAIGVLVCCLALSLNFISLTALLPAGSRERLCSLHSGNESLVWNFFAQKGLNPKQIAAICGNIQQESSFDEKCTSGQYYGLFQLGGHRKQAMFNLDLEKLKAENTLEHSTENQEKMDSIDYQSPENQDLYRQLEYIWLENFSQQEPYCSYNDQALQNNFFGRDPRGGCKNFNDPNLSVEEYTISWMMNVERCYTPQTGWQQQQERVNYANGATCFSISL